MPHRPLQSPADAPDAGTPPVGGDVTTVSLHVLDDPAEPVSLQAPYLVYYGAIRGEAVVHVDGEAQSLAAGQSLVIPPMQSVVAEAASAGDPPMEYVALKIDRDRVRSVVEQASEDPRALSGTRRWKVEEEAYCLVERTEGVHRVLRMLAYLFHDDPPHRDRLIDLNARELILLLLQSPSRPLLVGEFSRHSSTGGLAAVVQYVQDNLDRHISIDELVEEACMSKSSFYRHFGDEFDMSPLEFITRERVIRARELLSDPENTVTRVSHALGFSSTSHFIDMFKEHEGKTPKQYQLDVTA